MMTAPAVALRRWTRQEYDRLVVEGFFHPEERLELMEGEIVRMTPQGSLHATAIRLVEEALRAAFGTGFDVRVQMPLALTDDSEPEPDVAVVTGNPRDYRDTHPSAAVLIVEVADATVPYDRERKRALYARVGIADYWIVNLLDRRLEVFR
ncbi:MAG: Uma2 family endonuclease, partial [Nitrospiraceae bacterium]